MFAGFITECAPLGPDTVQTDAFGGCYLDRVDFARREEIAPGAWRMFDREDSSVPEHGPLWQYADAPGVRAIAAALGVPMGAR